MRKNRQLQLIFTLCIMKHHELSLTRRPLPCRSWTSPSSWRRTSAWSSRSATATASPSAATAASAAPGERRLFKPFSLWPLARALLRVEGGGRRRPATQGRPVLGALERAARTFWHVKTDSECWRQTTMLLMLTSSNSYFLTGFIPKHGNIQTELWQKHSQESFQAGRIWWPPNFTYLCSVDQSRHDLLKHLVLSTT